MTQPMAGPSRRPLITADLAFQILKRKARALRGTVSFIQSQNRQATPQRQARDQPAKKSETATRPKRFRCLCACCNLSNRPPNFQGQSSRRETLAGRDPGSLRVRRSMRSGDPRRSGCWLEIDGVRASC
jgi:hypothetical protein